MRLLNSVAYEQLGPDMFLLDDSSTEVINSMTSFWPTSERYRRLHARMEATTAEKHAQIRQLLGLPKFSDPQGRPFTHALPAHVFSAICARERGVVDVWACVQALTDDEWQAAKVRVKLAAKSFRHMSATLPDDMRLGFEVRVFIELTESLERWPCSRALACLNKNGKTFDTWIRRPYSVKENFRMMGRGSCVHPRICL